MSNELADGEQLKEDVGAEPLVPEGCERLPQSAAALIRA